jgi:hypothetical protein
MSVSRSGSTAGLLLLKKVMKRPLDYGLDYHHESLKAIMQIAIQHPRCLREAEASADRRINRCLKSSRSKESNTRHLHRRIRRQLLKVKEGLAWTDLNHLLNVSSSHWDIERYIRLARRLCVLASLCRYYRKHFSTGPLKPSKVVATRVARIVKLKKRGWETVRNHLMARDLDWNASVIGHLRGTPGSLKSMVGYSSKIMRRDRRGNGWLIKHSPESLMNPVLASIFARLSECPGAEICPSFVDYDPREKQPCSIQPYISATPLPRSVHWTETGLACLIGGSRLRASQVLCQTVTQWILDNIDRNQVIIDRFGNFVFVDHDRSFFIDHHPVTKDFQAALEARRKSASSIILAKVIKATAQIPGVLDDLAEFVTRVENIPDAVYEGLIRNASFREEQLSSIYYVDTMASRALGSIEALDFWIAHLLARKKTIRVHLSRRLSEVLGSNQRYL